jgi:hypothetical protein
MTTTVATKNVTKEEMEKGKSTGKDKRKVKRESDEDESEKEEKKKVKKESRRSEGDSKKKHTHESRKRKRASSSSEEEEEEDSDRDDDKKKKKSRGKKTKGRDDKEEEDRMRGKKKSKSKKKIVMPAAVVNIRPGVPAMPPQKKKPSEYLMFNQRLIDCLNEMKLPGVKDADKEGQVTNKKKMVVSTHVKFKVTHVAKLTGILWRKSNKSYANATKLLPCILTILHESIRVLLANEGDEKKNEIGKEEGEMVRIVTELNDWISRQSKKTVPEQMFGNTRRLLEWTMKMNTRAVEDGENSIMVSHTMIFNLVKRIVDNKRISELMAAAEPTVTTADVIKAVEEVSSEHNKEEEEAEHGKAVPDMGVDEEPALDEIAEEVVAPTVPVDGVAAVAMEAEQQQQEEEEREEEEEVLQ